MEDDTAFAISSNSVSVSEQQCSLFAQTETKAWISRLEQQQPVPAPLNHHAASTTSSAEPKTSASSSTCTTAGLKTFKRLFLFFSMIILMLASAVALALTASGLLQMDTGEQVECSLEKDAAELEKYDTSYLTLGFATLVLSVIGLLGVWKKNNCILIMFVLGMSILSIAMVVLKWTARNQEQADFKERYLALLPLTNEDAAPCTHLSNVHNWQAKFKCCGLLIGHQDWEFAVPDSCHCGPDDSAALCAQVSNSTTQSTNNTTRYYVQPCLPQVLPHVGKSILKSSPYVITIWVAIVLQVVDLLYVLHREASDRRYKSQRVPVVYIRMRPNSKAHGHLNGGAVEEGLNGGAVEEGGAMEEGGAVEEGGTVEEGGAMEEGRPSEEEEEADEEEADEEEAQVGWYESNECPMLLVPMEELERMVVFDPPPYTAVFKCHQPNEFVSKPFYVVHVPADAPLPDGAPRLIEGLDWARMTPQQHLENGHRVFLLPYPPAVNFCQDYS